MRVIKAENVADGWAQACALVSRWTSPDGSRYMGDPEEPEASRNGPVWVSPEPVTTVYERPCERVLLDPHRDANPFLHLLESLWMLAGRDDATWLDQFVGDFSARFAEPDGRQHGAYGRRWRDHFNLDLPVQSWQRPIHRGSSQYPPVRDQLNVVVDLLRANPADRQAVIQMWDPGADLGVPGLKDRPCNQQVMLRVRDDADPEFVTYEKMGGGAVHRVRSNPPRLVLDITVTCRSNDVVWGCYGANAVHFSILQEYLAARIGVGVGRYYQVSNNWHVYEWSADKCDPRWATYNAHRPYPGTSPLVEDPESFDTEVRAFVEDPSAFIKDRKAGAAAKNQFLVQTAYWVWEANRVRKVSDIGTAIATARRIEAPDWRAACVEWLQRRQEKRESAK